MDTVLQHLQRDDCVKPGKPRPLLMALGIVGIAAALAAPSTTLAADPPRRPNIVVILGDDLGYADMGAFGSEIRTPNLDALAKDGVRFTNFYTHASCSPTRAMLLTGVDTHLNGLGNMDEWTAPNQRGAVGYEGYLNNRVATLPQLLRDAGYHTYMVGKWHLGKAPDQIPAARGFERDFSLLDGAGSYWDMTNFTAASPQSVFTEDGRYLTKLPQGLLRDEDLHRQADRLHRCQPGRRQALLRLRGPPGAARPVPPAEGVALPPRRRVRQGLGRGPAGTAEATDRARHHARGHAARRADVVRARSHRAGAGEPGAPRQEDGALRGHGGEPRLPRRAARRPPEEDRRVREHDLRRVRRQRRRGHRSVQDDRRHARHARLPVRGDQLVADPSQCVGRPGFVRRVRPDVGAGVDDAVQPVQGLGRPKAASATRSSSAARPSSGPRASINHGLMHVADLMPTLLEIAGRPLPEDHRGARRSRRSWASRGARAGGQGGVAADGARTTSPGKSSAIARCARANWKLRWQFKPYGKADWELFNLAADPGRAQGPRRGAPRQAEGAASRSGTATSGRTT